MTALDFLLLPLRLFYSRRAYAQALGMKGWVFLYLLYLTLFTLIPPGISAARWAGEFERTHLPRLMRALPELTVRNGQVGVKGAAQPFVIQDPSTGRAVVTIDTRSDAIPDRMPAGTVLISRSRVTVSQDGGQIRSIPLGSLPDFTLNQAWADKWWPVFKFWGLVAGLFILWASLYVLRLLQGLVLAVISLPAVRAFRLDLDFGRTYVLAALTMTPATLFTMALDAFKKTDLSFWIFCGLWLGLTVYVCWGLRPAVDQTTPPDEDITLP